MYFLRYTDVLTHAWKSWVFEISMWRDSRHFLMAPYFTTDWVYISLCCIIWRLITFMHFMRASIYIIEVNTVNKWGMEKVVEGSSMDFIDWCNYPPRRFSQFYCIIYTLPTFYLYNNHASHNHLITKCFHGEKNSPQIDHLTFSCLMILRN